MCIYEIEPALLDLDVIEALDALVRRYVAEEKNRIPPNLRLSDRATRVYEAAYRMCEWRLGRAALNEGESDAGIPAGEANNLSDILASVKRIRKSVHLWNEQGGRQGYLQYIAHFLASAEGRRPTS